MSGNLNIVSGSVYGSDFIHIAEQTYGVLMGEADLSPRNTKLNNCLTHFVSAVLNVAEEDVRAILNSPTIQNLRGDLLSKLSVAEFEMEKYFGEHFASSGVLTKSDLDRFWYRQCYKDLVDQEVKAVKNIGIGFNECSRIYFVGSGPLPMTAIDMHYETGAEVLCVDSNSDAVAISSKMIDNLGLSNSIRVIESEASEVDYCNSDLIFVASLVANKSDVIEQIRNTAPNTCVGVRSVEGIKAMLYEPVFPDAFVEKGLSYAGKSQDTDGTINTTLFFRP